MPIDRKASVHVFTYGSLMFPRVWERVVRGRYRSAPALLDGHVRLEVAGETYPGMIAQHGSSVAGMLYFDIDAGDQEALDLFEGDDYARERVALTLEGGQGVVADTYLYRHAQRLSAILWRPEAFQLQGFLDTYCRDALLSGGGAQQ